MAYPVIPIGEAVCDDGPCLSDRESAELLADSWAVIDAANAKLLWLKVWFAGLM